MRLPTDSPVIDVGDRKQLFIDERFIAHSRGISLALNPAEKREIVLEPTQDEGRHEFQISTVLEVDGRYLMYYMTFLAEAPPGLRKSAWHVTRLARSDDGIHWERVPVGLIDVGRGPDNNIAMTGAVGTFFIDPNETDGCRFWWIGHMNENPWWGESRGAVFGGGPDKEGAVYLCRSRDGIRWERVPEPILPFWCDTRNQCLFDPRTNRHVAYLRARPGGHCVRVVCRAESEPLTGSWHYEPDASRQPGPHGLFGWIDNELPVVIAPDELDPPTTGLYTPNVHLYPWAEDVYLAFPETYRLRDDQESFGRDERGQPVNEGPLDIALLTSRDGVSWHRFREPYVRLGRIGEIDGGTIYMGLGMIRRGDELWQYCAVSPHTHHGRHLSLPGTEGGIRRLVQRLDGFVSADAGPEGGEITTPVLRFSGNRLMLNCDCSALGEVWVELQDPEGQRIPGYSMNDAVSVDLNGTGQEVWWKRGPDVADLAGQPVRLHIRMRSARLYAFQFVQSDHDEELEA
jgi:hypothetical protein